MSPLQTHLYEHSMMYGDADPDAYRQTLVSGKYRCYQMITIIVTVPKKDGTHKTFHGIFEISIY